MVLLKTGEEVVSFFSRNGLNNPIKFVICEKKYKNSDNPIHWMNRPYDLIVPNFAFEEK